MFPIRNLFGGLLRGLLGATPIRKAMSNPQSSGQTPYSNHPMSCMCPVCNPQPLQGQSYYLASTSTMPISNAWNPLYSHIVPLEQSEEEMWEEILQEMPKTKTLPFGKYKGMPLAKIEESYLDWLIQSSKEVVKICEGELLRREQLERAEETMVETIIRTGYRELAKSYHPDKTLGKTEKFQELQDAKELLKEMMKLVKES